MGSKDKSDVANTTKKKNFSLHVLVGQTLVLVYAMSCS